MTELETLKYSLTKMFGKTDEEITALLFEDDKLKDDAGDIILQLNEEKIAALKKARDENFNKGYQKAEKEVKTNVEKQFKELTGFNKDAENFEALIKGFIEEEGKKKGKAPITDDDIKKHPLFIQLEASRVPKEEFEKVINEYTDFKKNVQRNQLLGQIRTKAWDIISAKNPILPANQAISNTLRNTFLTQLEQFDYEDQDGKLIVTKDGKRHEDKQGNLVPFESFVQEIAGNFFEFQAQGEKGNAGNGGGGGATVTATPKTQTELKAIYAKHSSNSDEDRKMRIAAMSYYNANKTD